METELILSLDQSTSNTGWALFKDRELTDYGVIKAEGQEYEKINMMAKWLNNKIQELEILPNTKLSVILEDIQLQHQDVTTFKKLAHVQGVLENIIFKHNLPIITYFSTEWKSTCGVKGRTRPEQKKNAQLFVQQKYGMKPIQDTCDAICIGIHHIKQLESKINFE